MAFCSEKEGINYIALLYFSYQMFVLWSSFMCFRLHIFFKVVYNILSKKKKNQTVKINNDSEQNSCTIAHKSIATSVLRQLGFCDLVSSSSRGKSSLMTTSCFFFVCQTRVIWVGPFASPPYPRHPLVLSVRNGPLLSGILSLQRRRFTQSAELSVVNCPEGRC